MQINLIKNNYIYCIYMNNSNPSIEPRLSEYIRKKKFFEENNITPTVPLEKQYMITSCDLKKIKKKLLSEQKFTRNNTCDNSESSDDDDPNYIEYKVSQFPSTQIKDHRLNRITQKIKKDKDANLQRYNTDNLKKTYDMYSRDFSSTIGNDFNNEFSLNNILDDNQVPDLNDNIINFFQKSDANNVTSYNDSCNPHQLIHPSSNAQYQNKSSNDVNNQYNQYISYNQNKNAQNSLGMGYKKHNQNEINSFQRSGRFDIDTKVNIPSASMSKKSTIENVYDDNNVFSTPMRNIDYENYIKYGTNSPRSKAKSQGFDSVCANHFQFIDSDIQNPLHVVNDRPSSSRLDNRAIARSKTRDIY